MEALGWGGWAGLVCFFIFRLNVEGQRGDRGGGGWRESADDSSGWVRMPTFNFTFVDATPPEGQRPRSLKGVITLKEDGEV